MVDWLLTSPLPRHPPRPLPPTHTRRYKEASSTRLIIPANTDHGGRAAFTYLWGCQWERNRDEGVVEEAGGGPGFRGQAVLGVGGRSSPCASKWAAALEASFASIIPYTGGLSLSHLAHPVRIVMTAPFYRQQNRGPKAVQQVCGRVCWSPSLLSGGRKEKSREPCSDTLTWESQTG